MYADALKQGGKVFAVAPMIDWTDSPGNAGLQPFVALL